MNDRERRVAEIEADIARACGVLNVANAELVRLTGLLIEDDLLQGFGVRSVEHWLSWKAGLSRQRARQLADVARRRSDLPVVHDTFAKGELSFEQVHAVTTHATVHDDAELAALATKATVSQIRSILSRYQFAATAEVDAKDGTASPAAGDARIDAAMAEGSMSMVNDGARFLMRIDGPLDQGALIEQAMAEAKDALFQAGRANVSWFDALVEVCDRSLTTVTSAGRRDRFRTYVHLDTAGAWLNAGPAIPQAMADKLTCDGNIVPLWQTDSAPLSVGRSQRIVPDRTRRLVEDRDRTCVLPGCGNRHHLEVHHLVHWSDGGPTDTANLALLCCADHDAHHRGEFTIAGNADEPGGLTFTDKHGQIMQPGPHPVPPVIPLPGPPPGHSYHHPFGERIYSKWVDFSPPGVSA